MSANLPINWADKKNSPLLADFIAKYGSEYCMTAEEINQLRDAVNEMAVIQQSTFLGTAEPTAIPAGTGRAYWIALKQGTYPNHGNVVVGANEIAFIVRDAAGAFSISKTGFDLSTYASKSYVDGLVVGLLDDRGPYDASVNTFPTTGGSGASGAVIKGDLWYVSVAGTLGGKAVKIGACFRALVDAPAQVSTNWSVFDASLGYIPENADNKNSNIAADPTSTSKFPTNNAVVDYVAANGGKIKPFIDGAWPIDSQVNSLGKDWINTVATVAGEIPGTSSKWVERLSGYASKNVNFKKVVSGGTLAFQGFPNPNDYSYNTTTKLLTSTLSGGLNYSVAHSTLELKSLTLEGVDRYLMFGLGSDKAFIVSTHTDFIGKANYINSAGANVGIQAFPSTAIPSNATKKRIDITTDSVSISYSVDGANWILWGSVLKTALGFPYVSSKLGVTNLGTGTVNAHSLLSGDTIIDGIKFNHSNLDVKEIDSGDYVFLLNNNEPSGAKKVLASTFGSNAPFAGLKAALFGDSITFEYQITAGAYTNRIKSKLGLSDVVKNGYVGYCLGSGGDGTLADSVKLNSVIAQAPNLIIMLGGTNDYGNGQGAVLGNSDSTTITETAGGLRYILRYFQKNLPTVTLVMCTPTPRTTQTALNAKGNSLQNYVDIIKQVCVKESVPVIDLFGLSGINFSQPESLELFTTDGLHLSESGYERITAIQSNFIKNLK